ncbi:uncharacterized protein DSM5745_03203 [Aspergillus mulundensis]|uniref:Uncharacterized protein n=1 Tax=Aspergillus mulundensis TaxID=1810919 RepID=A0A3D8SK54_9EURO|nr:Uncharacterized protein DSM5745_03203 [Aspergillus mulundensis]RDW86561.1 Uncharacterized protein DSM5745_03203 [Aspergillus mulundensis]
MPTPERQTGQTAWARPQQQQHTSPFQRARRERLRFDTSHGLSPPRESPARRQRNFGQTGTLAGSFAHAMSRLPLTELEDDLFLPNYAQRGSPRRRQSTSAMSARSNPPELEDAYRQIEDAISLTDIDPDEENVVYMANKEKLNHRLSTTPPRREHRLSTASESSFTSASPRRRFNYTEDEERLRRATTSHSPVLDRTALGGGPSSEHLRRRDSESHSTSEEDYGIEPAVKAPSTWGSRAKSGNNWMKSLTRNHELASAKKDPQESSSRLWGEISSKRTQRAAESRGIVEDPIRSRYKLPPPPPAPTSSELKEEILTGGEKIPNTPIAVYKESTFTKRSPTKRDSHDLIRKLARTSSPGQITTEETQTPEATTTGRRIYDRTPAAPGAWIDTPMTQRASTSQPREVTEALRPRLDNSWGLEKLVEEARNKDKKEDAEGLIPNFEPLKNIEKKKSPAEQPQERPQERPDDQPKEEPAKETFELEHIEEEKEPQQKMESTSQAIRNSLEMERDWKPVELPLPDHPKSALETVLQEHKNNKDALDVGDDTIESLQAIVDQQPSEDTETQAKDDAAYEQQVIEELQSATSSEMKDFERIEGKLQSLSDNMSHVKSGLDQLENRVSRDNQQIIASISRNPVETTNGPRQPQQNCETCKRRGNGEIVHYCIPLPHLWERGRFWWLPRPTRLGWSILIPLVWFVLENMMCDEYCHPFFAETCEGYCLEPDAPRYPFVIPTMLWRWLHLSDILAPVGAILIAFSRIISQMMGLSDGFVDDLELPKINLTGKVWINGTRMEDLPPLETSISESFTPPVAQWETTTYVSEPMPEITPDPNTYNWDDISMDDDEFL